MRSAFGAFDALSVFGGRRRFNPVSVFAAGDVGWIYDSSNLNSMFQDAACTIPANQPGHPVGPRLDVKHGLSLGPEMVTNGDNEAALSAAPSSLLTGFVSREQSADRARSGAFSAKLTASALSSTHYWALWTVPANVAVVVTGSVYIPAGATGGQNIKIVDTSDGSVAQEIIAAGATDQWVDFKFLRLGKATAWPMAIGQNFAANWAGAAIYIDNLSIRELPGIHASQPVATSRPTLARRPASGVRNLLTYSDQFDNGMWNKVRSVVTPNAGVAPDGTMTADKLVEDLSPSNDHRINMVYALTAGAAYTFSIYAKAAERSQIVLYESASGSTRNVLFDLLAGTATDMTGPGLSPTISAVGGGWYRCSISVPTVTNPAGVMAYMNMAVSGSNVYTGNGTSGLYLWGAQLELGSSATAYQRVSSIYDVTEAGQPDRWCLVTDGVDDGMVTTTITPAVGADKVQVVAGVKKLSDAATGVLIELSPSLGSNNGSWAIAAPLSAGLGEYAAGSRGSVFSAWARTGAAAFPAPITNVITGLGDIAGDSTILRVNGELADTKLLDQGTGQFGTYPAYLYRRGGTSLPAKVEDYGMICRISTTNLTAAQIGQLEAWMNQRTGAY